jgi:peptidoglycan/LPS O-acetylase OafA/YrhL
LDNTLDLAARPVAAERIPELDGLRGIAILLVVGFHYISCQLEVPQTAFARQAHLATSFGWTGVDLFFILSGFLIGSGLLRNKHSPRLFRTFYMRRLLRIVPNYYLLIGLFLVIVNLPFFANSLFVHKRDVIPRWSYLLMVHNIYMGRLDSMGSAVVNVTWSIGIEEQFYLIFPLVVYFAPKKWIPYILLLAIGMASVVRSRYSNWIPRYVLLPCRMDAIAMGALIAYCNEELDLQTLLWKGRIWFMLVMTGNVAVCLYLFYRYQDLGINRHFFITLFFGGCLLAALAYKNTLYGALLRNGLLTRLGTISYSLYLFHYLILGLLEYSLLHYTDGVMLSNWKDGLVSVFSLGLSFWVAWLVYRNLETPLVKLGKRFKY